MPGIKLQTELCYSNGDPNPFHSCYICHICSWSKREAIWTFQSIFTLNLQPHEPPTIVPMDYGIWPRDLTISMEKHNFLFFNERYCKERERVREDWLCLCTPLCIQHNAEMGEKPGAEGVKPSFFHLSCSTRTRSKYFWSRKSYTFNSITQELCVNLGFNQLLALGLKHNLTPVQLPRSWDVSELLTLTHLLCSAALLCKVPLGVAWSDDAFARGYSVPH